MSFYERYVQLCSEHGMKPQNPEMQRITGVSSGAISGWKKGADPKVDVLLRLSDYFDVTIDYLLGLSQVRKLDGYNLTEMEKLLIDAYRHASVSGQANIIHVCIDEKKKNSVKEEIPQIAN